MPNRGLLYQKRVDRFWSAYGANAHRSKDSEKECPNSAFFSEKSGPHLHLFSFTD